ncbi:MAG TPA: hypothetical protein VIG33_12275 [Pseudobdellovibrionaceae bacterium]
MMAIAGWLMASVLSISLIAEAQIPKTLKCRGDLPIFCNENRSRNPFKLSKGLILVHQQECQAFSVGGTKEKPFIRLSPWAGIQYRTIQANVPHGFQVTLSESSDEDFHILTESKVTKFRKELHCSLQLDLRGKYEVK